MKPTDVKKILLIRLRSIGDLIVITPCTRAVKETYPDCHLAVAVEKGFEDIFLHNPYVDEVLILDRKNESFFTQVVFLHSLWRKRFDMVINLHGGPRSCIMALFSGAPYRVGGLQKRHHFNRIFNIRVAPFDRVIGTKEPIHIVNRHLSTLMCAGIKGTDNSLIFRLSPHDVKSADRLLKDNGMEGEEVVSIHCSASKTINRMSEEGMAEIADALIEKFNVSVALTGGTTDRGYAGNILARMRHECVNAAGRITIGEAAALYSRSVFFLGLDSGPSHIAAASGTYVISLFGPTSIHTWRPWTEKLIIIRKDMECIGCGNKKCDYGAQTKCLEDITHEDVISSIQQNEGLVKLL